jgi:outer membrane scaffolding protein for murein synthesis (MipA/OmpV family)
MGWSNLHCPIAKPVLAAILLVCIGCPALGQTPSPLQEWQYPGGIILQKEFEPEIPEWRVFLGAAGTVRPIYDGALPYRVQPGPVIDIRYRDIAFASVGEGLGVNVLRGENYRAGIALGYDLGRPVSLYPSHLNGLDNISAAPVVKLFGAYVISKNFPLVLRADVRRVIGGANGWIGDLGAYMPLPGSSKRFVMFAGPSLTLGDGGYMENVFGVTTVQAVASGYPRFNAGGWLERCRIWLQRHLVHYEALAPQR